MNRVFRLAIPISVLAVALVGGGCSSSKNSAASKKGGGATSAAAAKAGGQLVGQTAKAAEGSSTDEGPGGAGEGGGSVQENGGAHDATTAKAANEKVGATAKADEAKAADQGTTTQSFGGSLRPLDTNPITTVACDDEHQDEGFCADATHIVFCDHGHWYALDCNEAEHGEHCGEDTKTQIVDCHPVADFGGGVAIDTACDASDEGTAFCSDQDHVVFCDNGHWHSVACGNVSPDAACIEEDDNHVVDCAHEGDTLSAAH